MSDRTPEERERARLEREARRTGGEGARASTPEPEPEMPPETDTPIVVRRNQPRVERPPLPEDDVPLGIRRVDRRPPRSPDGPGAPAYRPRGRRRITFGRVFLFLMLLFLAVAAWFLISLYQPFHTDGDKRIVVHIPEGSSASTIGDLLEKKGVVADSFFFSLRASLAGDRSKLRAGRFVLRHDQSYGSVLTALTTAPKAAPTINVAIPEGLDRRRVAPLVRKAGVRGDYLAASRRSPLLDPHRYGAPRATTSLEGFLFPATYELVRKKARAGKLVREQLTAFKQNFQKIDLSYARRKKLTPYDIVIIASLIEGETAVSKDRPKIAAVIYNRLHQHIPLGIDATTRYQYHRYYAPILLSQLHSPSQYNTRLHAGLPPTPIGNPGLSSLRAAANPARVGYLYYVAKPGTCGNSFTSSYQQFLRLSARYQRERDRLHGRAPTTCAG